MSVAKNGQNPQFTQEEVNEIVSTAKEYGMKVAAHAHGVIWVDFERLEKLVKSEDGKLIDPEPSDNRKRVFKGMATTFKKMRNNQDLTNSEIE